VDIISQLFRDRGTVDELQFDLEFQEYARERATYAKHRVTVTEIGEVLDYRPRFFVNSGRAPIAMVGPTLAGRLLVVPVEPTSVRGIWRPVTAFEANARHRKAYEGAGQ